MNWKEERRTCKQNRTVMKPERLTNMEYGIDLATDMEELRVFAGTGRQINLTANYFTVKRKPEFRLHKFAVSIRPEVERVFLRKVYVRLALQDANFGRYLFDGGKELFAFHSEYYMHLLDKYVTNQQSGELYHVHVEHVAELRPGDKDYQRALLRLVTRCFYLLKLQHVGSDSALFDPDGARHAPRDCDHALEIWPGYEASLDGQRDLLQINIRHKPLRQDTAHAVLRNIYISSRGKDFKATAEKNLIGAYVMTRFIAKGNDTYFRVNAIDWTKDPLCTGPESDGAEVSYGDYFRDKFNITIEDTRQPLLISIRDRCKGRKRHSNNDGETPDREVLLVPELCVMVGFTGEMRSDLRLMKTMAQEMQPSPTDVAGRLERFRQRMSSASEAVADLRNWNLELGENLVNFRGRVLPTERLIMGAREDMWIWSDMGENWSMEIRGVPLLRASECRRWTLICPREHMPAAAEFMRQVRKTSGQIGFVIQYEIELPLIDSSIVEYQRAIDESVRLGASLVVCVIKENACYKEEDSYIWRRNKSEVWNRALYAAIKKRCGVENALVSQVIRLSNIKTKNYLTVATNVAHQLNTKLGGYPWTLHIPMRNFMVIGVDVQHDGRNRKKLVCGMVVSTNSKLTKYHSAVCSYSKHEPAWDLAKCLAKALEVYRRKNMEFPSRVFVYRSGVATRTELLQSIEIPLVLAALKFNEHSILASYIVVTRNKNTRILQNVKRRFGAQNTEFENAPPGTVGTDTITYPDRSDFFLVPHSQRVGTVLATYFNIIHNTSNLSEEQLHTLCFKLCHLYANSPATVPVPAPLLYAQRLTHMVAEYIHETPNERLAELLWFI